MSEKNSLDVTVNIPQKEEQPVDTNEILKALAGDTTGVYTKDEDPLNELTKEEVDPLQSLTDDTSAENPDLTSDDILNAHLTKETIGGHKKTAITYQTLDGQTQKIDISPDEQRSLVDSFGQIDKQKLAELINQKQQEAALQDLADQEKNPPESINSQDLTNIRGSKTGDKYQVTFTYQDQPKTIDISPENYKKIFRPGDYPDAVKLAEIINNAPVENVDLPTAARVSQPPTPEFVVAPPSLEQNANKMPEIGLPDDDNPAALAGETEADRPQQEDQTSLDTDPGDIHQQIQDSLIPNPTPPKAQSLYEGAIPIRPKSGENPVDAYKRTRQEAFVQESRKKTGAQETSQEVSTETVAQDLKKGRLESLVGAPASEEDRNVDDIFDSLSNQIALKDFEGGQPYIAYSTQENPNLFLKLHLTKEEALKLKDFSPEDLKFFVAQKKYELQLADQLVDPEAQRVQQEAMASEAAPSEALIKKRQESLNYLRTKLEAAQNKEGFLGGLKSTLKNIWEDSGQKGDIRELDRSLKQANELTARANQVKLDVMDLLSEGQNSTLEQLLNQVTTDPETFQAQQGQLLEDINQAIDALQNEIQQDLQPQVEQIKHEYQLQQKKGLSGALTALRHGRVGLGSFIKGWRGNFSVGRVPTNNGHDSGQPFLLEQNEIQTMAQAQALGKKVTIERNATALIKQQAQSEKWGWFSIAKVLNVGGTLIRSRSLGAMIENSDGSQERVGTKLHQKQQHELFKKNFLENSDDNPEKVQELNERIKQEVLCTQKARDLVLDFLQQDPNLTELNLGQVSQLEDLITGQLLQQENINLLDKDEQQQFNQSVNRILKKFITTDSLNQLKASGWQTLKNVTGRLGTEYLRQANQGPLATFNSLMITTSALDNIASQLGYNLVESGLSGDQLLVEAAYNNYTQYGIPLNMFSGKLSGQLGMRRQENRTEFMQKVAATQEQALTVQELAQALDKEETTIQAMLDSKDPELLRKKQMLEQALVTKAIGNLNLSFSDFMQSLAVSAVETGATLKAVEVGSTAIGEGIGMLAAEYQTGGHFDSTTALSHRINYGPDSLSAIEIAHLHNTQPDLTPEQIGQMSDHIAQQSHQARQDSYQEKTFIQSMIAWSGYDQDHETKIHEAKQQAKIEAQQAAEIQKSFDTDSPNHELTISQIAEIQKSPGGAEQLLLMQQGLDQAQAQEIVNELIKSDTADKLTNGRLELLQAGVPLETIQNLDNHTKNSQNTTADYVNFAHELISQGVDPIRVAFYVNNLENSQLDTEQVLATMQEFDQQIQTQLENRTLSEQDNIREEMADIDSYQKKLFEMAKQELELQQEHQDNANEARRTQAQTEELDSPPDSQEKAQALNQTGNNLLIAKLADGGFWNENTSDNELATMAQEVSNQLKEQLYLNEEQQATFQNSLQSEIQAIRDNNISPQEANINFNELAQDAQAGTTSVRVTNWNENQDHGSLSSIVQEYADKHNLSSDQATSAINKALSDHQDLIGADGRHLQPGDQVKLNTASDGSLQVTIERGEPSMEGADQQTEEIQQPQDTQEKQDTQEEQDTQDTQNTNYKTETEQTSSTNIQNTEQSELGFYNHDFDNDQDEEAHETAKANNRQAESEFYKSTDPTNEANKRSYDNAIDRLGYEPLTAEGHEEILSNIGTDKVLEINTEEQDMREALQKWFIDHETPSEEQKILGRDPQEVMNAIYKFNLQDKITLQELSGQYIDGVGMSLDDLTLHEFNTLMHELGINAYLGLHTRMGDNPEHGTVVDDNRLIVERYNDPIKDRFDFEFWTDSQGRLRFIAKEGTPPPEYTPGTDNGAQEVGNRPLKIDTDIKFFNHNDSTKSEYTELEQYTSSYTILDDNGRPTGEVQQVDSRGRQFIEDTLAMNGGGLARHGETLDLAQQGWVTNSIDGTQIEMVGNGELHITMPDGNVEKITGHFGDNQGIVTWTRGLQDGAVTENGVDYLPGRTYLVVPSEDGIDWEATKILHQQIQQLNINPAIDMYDFAPINTNRFVDSSGSGGGEEDPPDDDSGLGGDEGGDTTSSPSTSGFGGNLGNG